MTMPPVPDNLVRTTQGYFGDEGTAWLERLPILISAAADRWRLQLGEASPKAGAGFVCFAVDDDGQRVVLKIAFPHGEHFTGVEAMRVYDGSGCVRLLAAAEEDTQVLMEQILPGKHLYELENEEEEVGAAAALISRQRRPLQRCGGADIAAATTGTGQSHTSPAHIMG